MTAKKKTAEEEFDSAPDAEAEFEAADPLLPQEAVAPEVMADRKARLVDYIRSRPAAIADTAKALVTPGGGVDQSFADSYLMGLPAVADAALRTAPAVARKLAGNQEDVEAEWGRNYAKARAPYDAAAQKEPGANLAGSVLSPNIAGKATAGQRVASATLGAGINTATHGGDGVGAATLGAGIQGGLERASPLAGYLSNGLRTASEVKAVQSMGTRAGITDRLARMGVSPEDVPKLGRKFLDEGLVPSGLNPFKAPIDASAARAAALQKSSGARIGGAIGAAESSGAQFDPLAAAASMRSKMGVTNALENKNAAKGEELARFAEELAPQGEYASGGGFEAANRLKSQAWKGADFRTDPKMSAEIYKQSVRGLRDGVGEQVEAATSPEVGASLRKANSQYGTAAKALTLLDNATSRDMQKAPFGPLKHAIGATLGAGGAMAGGAGGLTAAAAPYITEQVVSRGPAIMSHAYGAASRIPDAANAVGDFVRPAGSASISATAGSALENYLRPMTDDERDKESAPWLLEN